MSSAGVQLTREFTRVLALPRRTWTEASATTLAEELSSVLRKPGGKQTLRPIQAQGLIEAGIYGGLFGPIRVGAGKTLLSLLAPFVLDARRPLLLLPAKLIEKTKREARTLASHWPIPNFIRFCSYELLGRVQAQQLLDLYQPDVIIADEAHKLRNKNAACTKRVGRYMNGFKTTKFVAMSGTFTKRSILDFAHILFWCLKNNSPLPTSYSEIEEWADALDEKKVMITPRLGLGALTYFQNEEERHEPDQLKATRRAYRRRLIETPGVVSATSGFADCSLTIAALWDDQEISLGPDIEAAFEKLYRFWRCPDDWPLMDPMAVWRVKRELSLGFYYQWQPRPPKEWAEAHKEWAKVCRDILLNNRRNLDSELQVTNAVADGLYPSAKPVLDNWRRIKNTFTPNSVPVWIDDSVIRACEAWAKISPGIIWTEHTAFAVRLAKLAKLSYYGKEGRDASGRYIEDHPPNESLIASIESNAEGRNLQAWNRNLITSCPANGVKLEQLIARTHREMQEADEVTFDLVVTSMAHLTAFEQALKDAHYEEEMSGPQKLLFADRLVPEPSDIQRPGYRWQR
jgi:hypothetical protein